MKVYHKPNLCFRHANNLYILSNGVLSFEVFRISSNNTGSNIVDFYVYVNSVYLRKALRNV